MDNMNNQDTRTADTISDMEIITRVLNGEKNLYALLVKRYNQRLYRACMAVMNNDAEAEDVMQVTYIKAYENLGKFGFKSSFSTWLTRILINESLLRLKKQKKSLAMNEDRMEHEMNKLPSANVHTPLNKVLNSELKQVLEEAIQLLPEKYRTVFVLREIEEMNVAETQECLGLSEANVKVRLTRAKVLLRDRLNTIYKKEELLPFHLTRCDRVTDYVMREIEKLG